MSPHNADPSRPQRRLEVGVPKPKWTSVMSRARNLALQTTIDCRSDIAVRSWDTMHMNEISSAYSLAVLNAATVLMPEELKDEGPTLLQSRNI